MYKSPIEIIYEIQSGVKMQIENGILEAVGHYGINVDKDELIRALQYDRQQYEKGYDDGKAEALQWIPCSEKLPFAEYGESQSVLTTCEHRNPDYGDDYKWVELLYYNGGVWCYPTGETYEERVIAWMPLPEPWKGESINDNRRI